MIGNNFDVPLMYQDLATSSMGPMSMPLMGGMPTTIGNTSYLGGVQMQRQLDTDKVQIMKQKDEEGRKTAKTVLKILGGVGAIVVGSILFKNIKKAGGLKQYFKNLWNGTPAQAQPQGPGRWQKFKNWFNNHITQPTKNLWSKFTNLFKKSTPPPNPPTP